MARLDRLGAPAKEVAQIGATIGREFSHALLTAVARKPEAELQSVLDRLVAAGLLFRQGVPPHATYLFKHALVQDAAYGTLLREPRRALHARIAATLESDFADIAENQPEVLARHYTEAGQIEKAAGLWGKAGQRSHEHSAYVEAIAQLTRALTQISALSATPALRRRRIEFQTALAYALMSTKGMAAPETTAALLRARLFIEQTEAMGEPSDSLQWLLVLNGFWLASYVAFNGDTMRDLAAQCLVHAEKQGAIVSLMMGHRIKGTSLIHTGDIAEGRAHLDQAVALYDRAGLQLGYLTRTKDYWLFSLSDRSLALWILGYPEAALADAERVVKDARGLGPRRQLGLHDNQYFESMLSLRKLPGCDCTIR